MWDLSIYIYFFAQPHVNLQVSQNKKSNWKIKINKNLKEVWPFLLQILQWLYIAFRIMWTSLRGHQGPTWLVYHRTFSPCPHLLHTPRSLFSKHTSLLAASQPQQAVPMRGSLSLQCYSPPLAHSNSSFRSLLRFPFPHVACPDPLVGWSPPMPLSACSPSEATHWTSFTLCHHLWQFRACT